MQTMAEVETFGKREGRGGEGGRTKGCKGGEKRQRERR